MRLSRCLFLCQPDLVLVDGGKGQVSATQKVLQDKEIDVPLIGLAKREETLVINQDLKFKELLLAKDSPALLLLEEIRDEAHRFAIDYHKKLLRRKLLG